MKPFPFFPTRRHDDLKTFIEEQISDLKEVLVSELDDATARIVADIDNAIAAIADLRAAIGNLANAGADVTALNAAADKLETALQPPA